jgi:hypothetical protein
VIGSGICENLGGLCRVSVFRSLTILLEVVNPRSFLQVIFVLPTAYPVTEQTFNYAPAAVGGTIALAGGYWILSAHRWFKGPISNVTNEEYTATDAKGAF